MRNNLAHIFESGGSLSAWWFAALALVGAALTVEHHVVAGFDRQTCVRRARCLCATVVVIALSGLLLPTSRAQPAASLPDLVSDPPRPSFFNEIVDTDDSTRLVLSFDGYVHNIGEGALDVVGNPQEPGGMKQRVQVGDEWEDIGSPTVRYETDDGHDHFHLIEAIEYVLWNEQRGQQTAIGSKVGFCLVDSEQMEPGFDQAYSEEKDNFCEEGNPGASSLRMGISPGWRDIYDATTTLQWVDVSNVAPGRYWIGAITDPNNEIVESNEDNNELIFSDRTVAVPGFEPLPHPPIQVEEAMTSFTLTSLAHGNVSEPVYVIERSPDSGVLDVPAGVDLHFPTIHYVPEPGFVGTDTVTFSVRDASSRYPYKRPEQTVTFEVLDGAAVARSEADSAGTAPSLVVPTTLFEVEAGEPFEAQIDVGVESGGAARVYARDLPPGLRVDAETGMISGHPVGAGVFDSEFVAIGTTSADVVAQAVTWFVTASSDIEALAVTRDRSSPRGAPTQLRVGPNVLGRTYEATGLPDGVAIDQTAPLITGTPAELGDFTIEVRQLDQGRVVSESSFVWSIRPAIAISFVL